MARSANGPDGAPSDTTASERDPKADGPDRRERLLNLLAALIETRAGLTREDLTGNPTLGYPPNPVSARRAFERDKATLRAMGVPIRDVGDDAETRYRVDPKEYYLPDLDLTADELAALHVAVTAIGVESNTGEGALMKLGGIEGTGAVPIAELPLVDVLAPLFEASRHRALVHFAYRGRRRTLEPWGLTSKFGHWYVVGFDRTVEDMRVFRADRVEGELDVDAPGAFAVPPDFRADSYLEDRPWDYGEGRAVDVVVRVDPGHEAAFVPAAGPDARARHQADGSTLVTIPAVEVRAVVNFVLGFLDHVEIVEPAEARKMIVGILEGWVA